MKILSLFDGMSCGQIALDQLGIKPTKYYASEIDKYAIGVTQHNYPETIQLGDINNWKEWDIEWSEIDLIYGGSPCQGFSFAGKQLAFDDPRSALFFVMVDIKNHINKERAKVDKNSCKFLLENVRMKKEYLDVISGYMGVQPVKINSSLVSAQNRVRFYWTNIAELEQPEDKGILLKDILEDNLDVEYKEVSKRIPEATKKGYVEPEIGEGVDLTFPKSKTRRGRLMKYKSNCLTAANYDYGVISNRCIQVGEADIKGHDQIKRVYSPEGKAPTVTTCEGGHREPKVAILQIPHGTNKGGLRALNGKTPSMTVSSWQENNKVGIIDTEKEQNYKELKEKYSWRKLTPLECERLQTVPDNYTLVPWQKRMMSNSQRYKMLGNGWTVEVIKHIFKSLL